MTSRAGITAGLLVAVSTSFAHAADEPKAEFPKAVRLTKTRINALPRYAYALPEGAQPAESPTAVTATLGKTKLVFVDLDGNGRYGDVGIDGWLPNEKGYGYMLPVEPWIAIEHGRAFLWFGPEGKKLRYRFEPLAFPEFDAADRERFGGAVSHPGVGVAPGLAVWNRLRMLNGLCPVYIDQELERGAILHAAYQARHGIGHTEEKGKAGYSEEGEKSARYASVGTRPVVQEVVGVYRTFYHRIQLFNPDTRGAGIGVDTKSTVIDGTRDRVERLWNWPVLIPAPGTTGVGRRFDDERPTVHDDFFASRGGQATGGFPITLTFPSREVTDVKAELRYGGPEGASVRFLLSSPEQPANARFPQNHKSICLIAHRNLKAKTTFWVKVSYAYRGEPGERIWTFRTARF